MANKKKEYYKPGPMTEGKRNIIQGLLQEYNIESAADIQEALKDLLGGTIKEMMEAEMDEHLGYEKSERSDSDDARNGYKTVVQLSKENISSQNVRVEFSLEEMDMSSFRQGATYEQIQEWVKEKTGSMCLT